MQVVRATRFGGPEVLEAGEAPDPVAGRGQVLVDVSFADTLFLDIVIRRGVPGPWAVRPPYVPGFGVAGRVSAIGAGVDAGWLGRRVVARPGAPEVNPDAGTDSDSMVEVAAGISPTNGYAEQAVVGVPALFEVPEALELAQAAALINDGLTAMQITEAAQVQPGEWVLVTPSGGGMGSLIVQLCHLAGARVIAGAGGRHKLDQALAHGAVAAVDYTAGDWLEEILRVTDGKGLDVALDGVGGQVGKAAFGATARGGRFFGFGSPSGSFTAIEAGLAAERGVAVTGLMELPFRPGDERRLPELALAKAAEGRITPLIGQSFGLKDAASAHAAIESREVLGKTLLTV